MIYENRKKGNGQESIQSPNTFRQRHQRERRTHLKQRYHNQNTTYKQKAKWTVSFPKIGPTAIPNKNFTKTYTDRSSKLQQKYRLGMVNKNITMKTCLITFTPVKPTVYFILWGEHGEHDCAASCENAPSGHARTAKAQIRQRGCAIRQAPLPSANKYIGFYRMYQWKTKARMTLLHFAHV